MNYHLTEHVEVRLPAGEGVVWFPGRVLSVADWVIGLSVVLDVNADLTVIIRNSQDIRPLR